jgi:hypothetical protein
MRSGRWRRRSEVAQGVWLAGHVLAGPREPG